jgi:hypothetical protein
MAVGYMKSGLSGGFDCYLPFRLDHLGTKSGAVINWVTVGRDC